MKFAFLIALSVCLLSLNVPGGAAESSPSEGASTEKHVEVVPALKMHESELATMKETHKQQQENQVLIRRILRKENLPVYEPEVPPYKMMSANSLLAVLNQLEYLELASKYGAEKPARPTLATGDPVENNRFLHAYNNAILRAITEKLGLPLPSAVDLKTGTAAEHGHRLTVQNGQMLQSIATKLGA